MKRKIALPIMLKLSLLFSLMSLPATTHGQPQPKRRPVADTGIIAIAPNQLVRVTVNALSPTGDYSFNFRRMGYTQGNCNASVCKQTLASQTNSGPIVLEGNEAASFDTGVEDLPAQASGARVVVFSSGTDVRVVGQIIDRTTGEVVDSFFFNVEALP